MSVLPRARTSRGHRLVRRAVAASAAALLAAGALVAGPAQATVDNGIWSLTPPPLAGSPSDAVSLEFAPGSGGDVPIQVTNLTSAAYTVSVNPTFGTTRSAPLVDSEDVVDSNLAAQWLRVSDTRVQLGPNGRQRLVVTVSVPATAKAGDYAATLITTGEPRRNPVSRQVTTPSLALRFNIRVTGALTPELRVSPIQVDRQVATFRITNIGNTALEPTYTITGAAANGSDITVPPQKGGLLLPGTVVDQRVFFSSPPQELELTVTARDAEPVKAQWPVAAVPADVLGPGEAPPAPPDPGSNQAAGIVYALLGLFVLMLIWWAIAANRARKRRLSPAAPPDPAAPTDAGAVPAPDAAPAVAAGVGGPTPPPGAVLVAPVAPPRPGGPARTPVPAPEPVPNRPVWERLLRPGRTPVKPPAPVPTDPVVPGAPPSSIAEPPTSPTAPPPPPAAPPAG